MHRSTSAFRWNYKQTASQLDLIYLAQGPRTWGDDIPGRIQSSWINRHWNYSLVPYGSPHRLEIDGAPLTLSEGEMIVIRPGALISILRQKPTTFHVMNWLWKSNPISELERVVENSWWKFRLGDSGLQQIRNLHAATRREILHPDTLTSFSLKLIHQQLDVTLIRLGKRSEPAPLTRHELAVRFLRNHPEIHDPVSALADYLEVSPSTVKRIFFQAGNALIRRQSLTIRMEEARQRLLEGKSVKEVALSLGYKHANDFSRAYVLYHGKPPRFGVTQEAHKGGKREKEIT